MKQEDRQNYLQKRGNKYHENNFPKAFKEETVENIDICVCTCIYQYHYARSFGECLRRHPSAFVGEVGGLLLLLLGIIFKQ